MLRTITMTLSTLVLFAAPVAAQEAGESNPEAEATPAAANIEVEEAAVGTGVEDRILQGASFSFKSDVGKVYFHTTLKGNFGETEVQHVWKHEGEEVAKVTLKVKGPTWRTWSSKTIPEAATGNWTVAVVDGAGNSLKEVAFTIEAGEGAATTTKTTTMNTKAMDKATERKAVTKPTEKVTADQGTTGAGSSDSTEAGIHVEVAAVGTSVEDRELAGKGESFPADVGKVYFYTTLTGDFGDTELEHVWTWKGQEVSRVSLKAHGPRWRTWSSKTIPTEATGDWQAQVVSGGKVLETVSFKIGG